MHSIDDAVHAAGARVAHWLLHGPAQVAAGPHAGGVAGTLDAHLRPRYVYPEDTGYYLQWLAWRAAVHGASEGLFRRAQAAQRWLHVWIDLPQPLTRIYLEAPADDWRNRTRFTFDVAMALRGLGTAVAHGLVHPDASVVSGLCRELATTIAADGVFDACVRSPGDDLPDRWSTRRGGFLLKAAAGILHAAQQLPQVPKEIVEVARATFDHGLLWALEAPHDEAHPLLYTFEGILGWPEHPRHHTMLREVVRQFEALLTLGEDDGRLPESRSHPDGPERVDVLAQTIRVGDLLRGIDDGITPRRLRPLRQRLVDAVRPDGAVAFALQDARSLPNVWAAMFASQALEGVEPAPRDAPPLIV
ncbi:MAG TPA: hypothetical protein VFC24_11655 [Casimicrobiaceae bacterium]|nr:hypothetical protein [Casimicrobiaceae bacterium]